MCTVNSSPTGVFLNESYQTMLLLQRSICRVRQPKFLRVSVIIIHRLYALQVKTTSLRDASFKIHIIKGTQRLRKNVQGDLGRGHIVMASFQALYCSSSDPSRVWRCSHGYELQIFRLPGKGGYSIRPLGTTSSLIIWVESYFASVTLQYSTYKW